MRGNFPNCSKKVDDRRPFIAALVVPDRRRIAADLKRSDSALTDSELERILWERVERINEGMGHYEKIRRLSSYSETSLIRLEASLSSRRLG